MPKTKTLGRGVAMVGAGMSKFGAFAEKNSRDLFVESYKVMTRSVDKGFDPSVIDAVYIGNFSSDQFEHEYGTIFDGDENWRSMPAPATSSSWIRASAACATPPRPATGP